ncbi:MAG: ABC transporter substrate-binding protein [Streptomycetaceae bacterium]|nr:ABC transporter substrate-binding protein [Streptomycetaceae bacterium]
MTTSLDRRRFIFRGLQAGGLLLSASALAACGDDKDAADSAGSSGGGRFGKLDFRFAWLKNVEFAGSYLADTRGYFREEGFGQVNFITGGPSAPPIETDVVTGKAFLGLSSPDRAAAAVKQGAKIVIVASQYQKNPFALMSMADKPINSPQEMIGKKIGVSAANEAVWQAFLKANDIPESKITKVPVQFDPLPLTTGTVDGWMCYITNEPTVLRLKGHNVSTFLFADFNYPITGETYIVTRESLAKNPDKVMAALRAEIRGWKDSLADPAAGAKLAVETYGKDLGLNLDEQVTESGDQNKLILTDDTRQRGIFTMTPALVEANVRALKFAGSEVTAEELFDLSLIDRIYQENPQLV